MQGEGGKPRAQHCAQVAWISTGDAGMNQFPWLEKPRRGRKKKKKGLLAGKTKNWLLSFAGGSQFASKPLQARVDFCFILPSPGGLVIALVPQ